MTTEPVLPKMKFELLRPASGPGARLGRLTFPARIIETPGSLGITSRGVLPHLTPDTMAKHTHVGAVYMGLEDFVERLQRPARKTESPPIFDTPCSQSKRLHTFTAMPPSVITVLGPRRLPAVDAVGGNSRNSIPIFTSTGCQTLTTEAYHSAMKALDPDIVIPMADISYGSQAIPSAKRADRMVGRTEKWVQAFFVDPELDRSLSSVFVPLLPVPYSLQQEYLERLSEDLFPDLSGLALYDVDILPDLERMPNLLALPRLSMATPISPHHVLRQIRLGVDVLTLPFINAASDAGVALTYTFPPPYGAKGLLPLGVDMSSREQHQTDLSPLYIACRCYSCTRHHRAYLNHLLQTREMLGWTLLQIHNHAVANAMFAGVRTALYQGREVFEEAVERFETVYEPEIPAGLGERPRARGYHFKSEGGGDKTSKPIWRALQDDADKEVETASADEKFRQIGPRCR